MKLKKLVTIVVAVCLIMSFTAMAADAPAADSPAQEQGGSDEEQVQDGESGGDSAEGESSGESDGESAEGESDGDSAGMMGSSYISVKDDEVDVTEDGEWTVEGNVPEGNRIAGIRFTGG